MRDKNTQKSHEAQSIQIFEDGFGWQFRRIHRANFRN
jgi:hypothetical protein